MAEQYLGLDLSTQQLKALVVGSDLKLLHEAKVDFDTDFGAKYKIQKGVLTNPAEGEVFAPVALFLDAVDLVLLRLKEQGVEFAKVKGISGAGMQHGTVFWSQDAEKLLGSLDPGKSLIEQLVGMNGERDGAFSHPYSPNWQDASTQVQCEGFDAAVQGPKNLADATGSSAHHRFSGPQIQRFREKHPQAYKATSRISLVSSFLASIFLGKIAPIDISDVCGANLWDIPNGRWHDDLLSLAAGGGASNLSHLKAKLGSVPEDGGASFGHISPYFCKRYGFPASAQIIAFTGDNPSTILSLPLRASDAVVSLGTSTTFLMSTAQYKPDPAYHFMNHPTTPGLYMFMLCYKNGSLAREQIRDAVNKSSGSDGSKEWDTFNQVALKTPVLGQKTETDPMNIGVYFPRPEIVPNVKEGTWRYFWENNTLTPQSTEGKGGDETWSIPNDDARAILESQFLSLRLRSQPLLSPSDSSSSLPPQPRRIYLVGGGAVNPAIASLAAQVLGGTDGVYKLDIGGNACALGAAYKAAWGVGRGKGESFEDFLEKQWKEEKFIKKIEEGYRAGVWEKYGEAVGGLREAERRIVGESGK